jgi:hypothetical protein
MRREQGEWNATGETNNAAIGTVAKVHNSADSARPHGIWDGHAVKHRGCVVPECAPRAFRFVEHVVTRRGRELYTDAHVSTHLTGKRSFKDIVKVKFNDRGESVKRGVVACIKMADL